jgi:hypothetical protein
MDDFSSYESSSNEGMRPVAIVSQLLQSIVNIHHIDELLMWIANTMIQRSGIDTVQVWATQAHRTGALYIKLRASASQHLSQARGVSESTEVAVLIERMMRERRGIQSVPITNIFSQYQAAMLMQQNYRYWTAYFVSRDVLLPPMQRGSQEGEIATPLQLVFSFFTQQPLQTTQTRAIRFLVEQSLRIAISHNLLSPKTQQPSGTGTGYLKADGQYEFAHHVPRKVQKEQIEQAENPFNSAVILSEKRSRQVYSLIDGKKDVAELALLTNMSQKEVLEVLQSLLTQGHISYTR